MLDVYILWCFFQDVLVILTECGLNMLLIKDSISKYNGRWKNVDVNENT